MVDEQILKLFEGVLSKTRGAEIAGHPTADESTFMAAIGGHFILSVSAQAERISAFMPLEKYTLVLKDQTGSEPARITESDEGMPQTFENYTRQRDDGPFGPTRRSVTS